MKKLLVAALFTLGWGLVAAAPAVAAEVHVPFCGIDPVTLTGGIPGCSFTQNVHGQVSVDNLNVNTCSGVVGTATMVTNSIVHVTVNGAGDIWITQTATTHFTFVPNSPGPPSYHGEFTFWFGVSLNKNNVVMHDILNVVVNGSDGSQITAHMVDHFSLSASGAVNQFSIASMSCP
jgi:hypothetical protein